MPIDLALHEYEIGRVALIPASYRGRELVQKAARLFAVVICAIALAGCGCTTCDRIVSRTANGKASTGLKFRTPIPLPAKASLSPEPVRTPTTPVPAKASLSPETARTPTTPVPAKASLSPQPIRTPTTSVPAMELLSPQPESDCEVRTGDSNFDERQKLDYERQCYRHAEMIVRNRLELLQSFGR